MVKKYNNILVEFDFLIDLDLAMFKLIKAEYNNPDYVNQKLIRMSNECDIIKMMIERQPINPLELLIPEIDTLSLYLDIMENHMDKLLQYAKACGIFGLMVTFLKEATSITITVLCKSELESNFIKSLNSNLNTIVKPNRKDILLDDYTVLYIKYFPYALQYGNINGKHIYIANARYNMEPNKNTPTTAVSVIVGQTNIIHMIDLYKNIKFERVLKDE